MNKTKMLLMAVAALLLTVAAGCTKDEPAIPEKPEKPGEEQPEDEGKDEGKDEPDAPAAMWSNEDLAWVFDMEALPEIRVDVSLDEWNRLLKEYDRDSNTAEYIHCNVEYKGKGEQHYYQDAAIRLRGNTSRRRPEGNGGQMHTSNNTDWHHCHFMINLRKYQKDDDHELHNIRKLHLKWFKDDSDYCRELYCYDLMRRFGIWTACFSSYCRLWIHVEGDSQPAYYGVYSMLEPIDDKFVSRRKELFDG